MLVFIFLLSYIKNYDADIRTLDFDQLDDLFSVSQVSFKRFYIIPYYV